MQRMRDARRGGNGGRRKRGNGKGDGLASWKEAAIGLGAWALESWRWKRVHREGREPMGRRGSPWGGEGVRGE